MSAFCIVELTRQRMRPSLKEDVYGRCPSCNGAGLVRSEESQALLVMRDIQRAAANEDVANVSVTVAPAVAERLTNFHRHSICRIESKAGKTIRIHGNPDMGSEQIHIECTNNRGSVINWDQPVDARRGSSDVETVAVEKYQDWSRKQQDQEQPERPPAAEPEAKPAEPKQQEESSKSKKPRRRRRKKKSSSSKPSGEKKDGQPKDEKKDDKKDQQTSSSKRKKSKRRGRRGGRKHRKKQPAASSS
jgi:ribonuclease E